MSGTSGGVGQASASEGPGSGERAELEAPHAEAAEPGGRPRKAHRHRFSWRTPVASLLIIVGCILAPVSVLGVWTANQVSDTSRYVANVAPLIKDPAIQNALTDKLTSEIVTKIDVKRLTDQAAAELSQKGFTRIGGLLQGVSGSLASGVQGFVHSSIHKIITGPRMANAWTQVNRVASQQLVAVLSGSGGKNGAVGVSNGQVTLDIAPLEAVAKQDLVARGLTIAGKIPIVHATVALFPSKNLVKAQKAYRLINDLKIVLPILTLVLLGLGVFAARGHRRALIGAGLGFAASMLVLGAGLAIARALYLNSVPASASGRRGRRRLRHLGPVHQDRAAHPAGGGPDRGRRRVLHRAVRRSGSDPVGVFLRPWPAAPRRRIRRPVHRPGGHVDLHAPACAAHRGGGAGRADLRLLGPADRRGDHRDRRPAAGGARPHRTDRQTPTAPRASAAPCARRVSCGPRLQSHSRTRRLTSENYLPAR